MKKLGFVNPPLTLAEKRHVANNIRSDPLDLADLIDRMLMDGLEIKLKPLPEHSAITVNLTPTDENDINYSFILSHFGGDWVVVLAQAAYWHYEVCGDSSWEHNAVSIKYFEDR